MPEILSTSSQGLILFPLPKLYSISLVSVWLFKLEMIIPE